MATRLEEVSPRSDRQWPPHSLPVDSEPHPAAQRVKRITFYILDILESRCEEPDSVGPVWVVARVVERKEESRHHRWKVDADAISANAIVFPADHLHLVGIQRII